MAKESSDKKLEGEASYRLGLGYEKNKDYGQALHVRNFFSYFLCVKCKCIYVM